MATLSPLRVEPRYAEAIWGGRRLADELGKPCSPDRPTGESWEVFGANRIVDGPFAGQTLDDAARHEPDGILGTRVRARQDSPSDFPLLIKFIDAHLPLSVQVHPDDAFAREHEAGSRGKTEAWYILGAPTDGTLVYGLRDGVSARQVGRSVARGELERHLTQLTVQPGDAVFIPAGTVHAIGAGILLYEVQQRSEITYRLYDWGRVGADGRPRALHVDKALAVLQFPQPAPRTTTPLRIATSDGSCTFLAACPYFALAALEGTVDDTCDGATFAALSTVMGHARLHWADGEADLGLGASVVLPAGLGSYRIEVSAGGRVLRATVPDLDQDLIAPLRTAGYALDEIGRLGDISSCQSQPS